MLSLLNIIEKFLGKKGMTLHRQNKHLGFKKTQSFDSKRRKNEKSMAEEV